MITLANVITLTPMRIKRPYVPVTSPVPLNVAIRQPFVRQRGRAALLHGSCEQLVDLGDEVVTRDRLRDEVVAACLERAIPGFGRRVCG